MSELLILAARQIDLPSFYSDLGAAVKRGGGKPGESEDGERKTLNFNRQKMVVEALVRLSIEKLGSEDAYKECCAEQLPGFLVSEITAAIDEGDPRYVRKALGILELSGRAKIVNDSGWRRWRCVK
jgi:hypothetical protein